MCVPTYLSPADFLRTIARRLRTTPERVPAARATEELLSWIESCTAEGVKPQPVFLHAFRLVYEHARLVIGPSSDQIDALAERLAAINANRPQAEKWTRTHWRKLARLVLENRRLPVVALFSAHPPTPEELIASVELPFAARYVDDPTDLDARRIPSPPVMVLLDRAQELLEATSIKITDIRTFVETLRTAPYGRVPRRPPRRALPNPFPSSAAGTSKPCSGSRSAKRST